MIRIEAHSHVASEGASASRRHNNDTRTITNAVCRNLCGGSAQIGTATIGLVRRISLRVGKQAPRVATRAHNEEVYKAGLA